MTWHGSVPHDLFVKIFSGNSRVVGYLGPPGTFTHRAVQADPELAVAAHQPFPDLAAIFRAVAREDVGQAVVAWDNSLAGPVPDAMDLLAKANGQVQVRRDLVMPVRLCLWGRRGALLADISTVVSHPHALAQCAGWLQAMLPAAACAPASSTAAALGSVTADRSGRTAAAAPQGSPAADSAMVILAPDISDVASPQTRFMVIGSGSAPPRDPCRTVLECSAPLVPAAEDGPFLATVFAALSGAGVVPLWLGTRPARTAVGDLRLVLECRGEPGSSPLRAALARLARGGVRTQVLGVLAGAEAKRVGHAW